LHARGRRGAQRLTYDYDGYTRATCFTNDGKVIYRTLRYNHLPTPQLIKLTRLPLSASRCRCRRDRMEYMTKREFCTLPAGRSRASQTKRYKGGTIEQIWRFDDKTEASCLTCDFDGTSTRPMLYNNRIYFLSDRDGTMNIWSMGKDGKGLKQETASKGWDLRSPSMYAGNIVYQKGRRPLAV